MVILIVKLSESIVVLFGKKSEILGVDLDKSDVDWGG